MKLNFLLISAIAILSGSCSSVYKSMQTPDDVYFSPAKPVLSAETSPADSYQSYTASNEDAYLRMKVQDHYKWAPLDDYGYWNDSRYDFGYSDIPSRNAFIDGMYPYNYYTPYSGYGWNTNFFLGYNYWGNWYSPYSTIVFYKNPKVYYGTVSTSNLNSYYNRSYNNANSPSGYGNANAYNNSNTYNNANNANSGKSSFGTLLKQVFTPGTSNNNPNSNTWSQPVRTFNSGNNPSPSSGGNSGGFNSSGSSSGGGRSPRH